MSEGVPTVLLEFIDKREWLCSHCHISLLIRKDEGVFTFLLEFVDERGPHDWSEERFRNMIRLRQDALDAARALQADYLLVNIVSASPALPVSLLIINNNVIYI